MDKKSRKYAHIMHRYIFRKICTKKSKIYTCLSKTVSLKYMQYICVYNVLGIDFLKISFVHATVKIYE